MFRLIRKVNDLLYKNYKNSIFLIASSLLGAEAVFWVIAIRVYPTEYVKLASAIVSAMSIGFSSRLGLGNVHTRRRGLHPCPTKLR